MAKIFYDTEFLENGETIVPISIGMVNALGAELYYEFEEFDWATATPWLNENVKPHMTGNLAPRERIRKEIVEFVGPHPEFWAWYADYDHVLLCQLFGRMIDLPANFPMFTMDLRQYMAHVGFDPANRPPMTGNVHNALDDAKWVREGFAVVRKFELERI